MRHPAAGVAALLWLLALPAMAQQPVPLFNTLKTPVPAVPAPQAAQPDQTTPSPGMPAPTAQQPQPPAPPPEVAGRVFCGQNVTSRPANPSSVPEPYRQYVGFFSDADWTPQLCAALIVETVAADGTATITYVFGPLDTGGKASASGVLHGTGIVKDGALLFQNSDGSQYAFQPFYSDLAGKWTTPQGQTYEAIFKRSFRFWVDEIASLRSRAGELTLPDWLPRFSAHGTIHGTVAENAACAAAWDRPHPHRSAN